MEEQLITYETYLLAKQKGCDLEMDSGLFTFVNEDKEEFLCNYYKEGYIPEITMTQSLLQKWLREIHKKVCCVMPYNNIWEEKKWECFVENVVYSGHNTYEEALEEGLKQTLKTL